MARAVSCVGVSLAVPLGSGLFGGWGDACGLGEALTTGWAAVLAVLVVWEVVAPALAASAAARVGAAVGAAVCWPWAACCWPACSSRRAWRPGEFMILCQRDVLLVAAAAAALVAGASGSPAGYQQQTALEQVLVCPQQACGPRLVPWLQLLGGHGRLAAGQPAARCCHRGRMRGQKVCQAEGEVCG